MFILTFVDWRKKFYFSGCNDFFVNLSRTACRRGAVDLGDGERTPPLILLRASERKRSAERLAKDSGLDVVETERVLAASRPGSERNADMRTEKSKALAIARHMRVFRSISRKSLNF